MANTYSQIYIHIVFAVKGRQNLIPERNREELQKYISGITANQKQKLYAVYCMTDHVHLLVSLSPDVAISNLVRDIKANSSRFINEKGWMKGKFEWQQGYGAFSHSHSQTDAVVKYILSQQEHHAKKSFRDEYLDFLKRFNVQYDERYIFEFID